MIVMEFSCFPTKMYSFDIAVDSSILNKNKDHVYAGK